MIDGLVDDPEWRMGLSGYCGWWLVFEGSVEEGGHLRSGYGLVGAVAERVGVTADCDACSG